MADTILCPMCEAERSARRETVREEYDVRGERIALSVPRLICDVCGESVVEDAFGDVAERAYAEYRRRHGLLTAKQIRAIREKYALSQDGFAILLGTSPATLARYEGGSLQDKAYDQLLRACENPVFVDDLVAREGDRLSPRQLRDVRAALAGLLEPPPLVSMLPDLRGLKWDAYAAVVVWFSRQLRSIPETKMCKLLFYSDFLAYQEFGEAITGVSYRRFPFGPVPAQYDVLHGLLEGRDLIGIDDVPYPSGFMGREFRIGPAACQVDRVLDGREVQVLEFVAKAFGRLNAKQISDRSHEETAWKETPPKAWISYDHAARLSIRLPKPSEAARDG